MPEKRISRVKPVPSGARGVRTNSAGGEKKGFKSQSQVSEELYRHLTERKRGESQREAALDALAQQNEASSKLNRFSIELSMLSPEDNLEAFIAKRIKEITGAVAAIFSEYNPENRTLTAQHIEMEPGLFRKAVGLLGKQVENIHSPVSEEMYREITTEIIGMRRTLYEASFGTVSRPVGAVIQALLKVDRFIGIAYLIEGKLYGTSVLAMSKDQPDLPKQILENFSFLAALSLRSKQAESQREAALDAQAQQNEALSKLNRFSIELSMLSPEDNLEVFIAKRIKEIAGAMAAIFFVYNSENRTLTAQHFEMEPGLLKKVARLLGKQVKELYSVVSDKMNRVHSEVSDEMYREMTNEIIGMRSNLYDVTFGAISRPFGATVKALLKADRFIGVAYLIEGKLYGTSLLVMSKGQPDPPKPILENFILLAAVSLRRKQAESQREAALEALAQQNEALSKLNRFSIELSTLSTEDNLEALITKRIKEITGAVAAIFSEYNPENRTMTTQHIEMDPWLLEKAVSLLDKQVREIHFAVSDEMYREVTSEIFGMRRTLYDVLFGAVSRPVGAAIQALLKADRFIGVAYLIEGKLYGTSVVAMSKGQPDPPKQILENFTFLAALSLRRKRAVSQREAAEEALRKSESNLRALAMEFSRVEASERQRLALFLHDEIGQSLALVQLKLGSLVGASKSKFDKRQIKGLRDLLEIIIEQTHSLTFELSPPVLHQLGLAAAIEWAGEKISRDHGFNFTLNDDGVAKSLNFDLQAILFRCIRELMLNTVKHAQAKNLTVAIAREGEEISFAIADDGRGFDPSLQDTRTEEAGFGLLSVREHLAIMGGACRIQSAPGQGTRITLTVPLGGGRRRSETQHAE